MRNCGMGLAIASLALAIPDILSLRKKR